MDIKQTTIPHNFRNKYLRSGNSTVTVGNAYDSTSEGSTSTTTVHAKYADIAEEAKHLSMLLNIYGNPWSGTTDLNEISATTIVSESIDSETINALTAYLLTLSGNTATFDGDLNVSGDTNVTDVYSDNITNTDTIRTKNLVVTGSAHFFELIIDKINSAGGAVMLTPADGFNADKVEEIEGGYRLYFRSTDENGKGIMNMWKVNDQAICKSFNQAEVGTGYNVNNKYYWSLVTGVDANPVSVDFGDGETHDCHYIDISSTVADGTVNPESGDEIVMLGYRGNDDTDRQSAIYIASYSSMDLGLKAPLFATYQGINDFNLESHRKTFIDATRAEFVGSLKVSDGTTVEDYINGVKTELENEFKVDINGLTSRVSKTSKPNILPSNGWKDHYNNNVFQEDDENFTLSSLTPEVLAREVSSMNGGIVEPTQLDTYVAYPPVMYLDKGNYTMSVYNRAKYVNCKYGETRDDLNMSFDVATMINSGDTWHGESRSITRFIAPFNGYYQLGIKPMDETYTGDTPYVEVDEEDESGGESGGTSGNTSGNTFQYVNTRINYNIPSNLYGLNYTFSGTTTVYPDDYKGIITYKSSDTSLATVDNKGVITTKNRIGTVTITATATEWVYGNKKYKQSISSGSFTTMYGGLIMLDITNPISEMTIGSTHQLNVNVTPSTYDKGLTYTSSNPSVATVSNTGLIRMLSSGETEITVSAQDTVLNGIRYITGDPESLHIQTKFNTVYNTQTDYILPSEDQLINTTIQGHVTVTPSTYKGNITYKSNNQNVATVDTLGNISFLSAGTVTITATANSWYTGSTLYNSSYDSETITARDTFDTSIVLSVDDIMLSEHGETVAHVKVSPSHYPGIVTFSSSDEDILTVDEDGIITAVGMGEAQVIATAPYIVSNGITYKASVAQQTISVALNEYMPANNEMLYIPTQPNKIDIDASVFNANPVSTEWTESGYVVTFDSELTAISAVSYSEKTSSYDAYGKFTSSKLNSDNSIMYLDLPGSITEIPDNFDVTDLVFIPSSLQRIKLHAGTTKIGEKAFRFANMSEVKLPSTITQIGTSAFGGTPIDYFICPPKMSTLGKIFDTPWSVGSSYNCSIRYIDTNNVKTIEQGAFSGCYDLETIVIGDKTEFIHSWCFSTLSSIPKVLKRIACKAINPPIFGMSSSGTMPADEFLNYEMSGVTLYVPEESISAYSQIDVWKTFKEIKPLSEFSTYEYVKTSGEVSKPARSNTETVYLTPYNLKQGNKYNVEIATMPHGMVKLKSLNEDICTIDEITGIATLNKLGKATFEIESFDFTYDNTVYKGGKTTCSKTFENNSDRKKASNLLSEDDWHTSTWPLLLWLDEGEYKLWATGNSGVTFTVKNNLTRNTFSSTTVSQTKQPYDSQSYWVDGKYPTYENVYESILTISMPGFYVLTAEAQPHQKKTGQNDEGPIYTTVYGIVKELYVSNNTKPIYNKVTPTITFADIDDVCTGRTVALNTTVDNTKQTIKYKSNDTNIAVVSENGIVSGISSGQTTIIAYVDALYDEGTMYLYKEVSKTVNVNPYYTVITTSPEIKFLDNPVGINKTNCVKTIVGANMMRTYTSSNPSVASFDDAYTTDYDNVYVNLYTHKTGSTIITCSADACIIDGKLYTAFEVSDELNVVSTINKQPHIRFTQSPIRVHVGDNAYLYEYVSCDVDEATVWFGEDDSYDMMGMIDTSEAGTYRYRAYVNQEDYDETTTILSAETYVTVIVTEYITVTPTITVPDTVVLYVGDEPTKLNASINNNVQTLYFRTDDNINRGYFGIDSETGIITPRMETPNSREVWVIADEEYSGNYHYEEKVEKVTVIVCPSVTPTIDIDEYGGYYLPEGDFHVGDTKQSNLWHKYENDAPIKYRSSNTSVATVNSNGLVTAVSPGEVVITAYTELTYVEGVRKILPSSKDVSMTVIN